MPRSSKKFRDARFCPLCGCESLERDDYREGAGGKHGKDGRSSFHFSSPEFICTSCGMAFGVVASLRHQHAVALLHRERKLRPSGKADGTILDDGFGNQWSSWCSHCQRHSMQIVRPGKIQCGKCG